MNTTVTDGSGRMRAVFVAETVGTATAEAVQSLGGTTVTAALERLTSDAVSAAHHRHLDVWGEFACFQGAALWERYPHSRPVVDSRLLELLGAPGEPWYAGVIPLAEVAEDRLDALRQGLDRLPALDGVWLDFCRFPGHWEHGPGAAISAPGIPEDDAERARVITDFVRRAMTVCTDRGVRLGAFVTPFDNERYGQDLAALGAMGVVLAPMVYHGICGRSVDWIRDRTDACARLAGVPVLPVIQSVPVPGPMTGEEFVAVIREAERASSLGAMIFTLDALTPAMAQQVREHWTIDGEDRSGKHD